MRAAVPSWIVQSLTGIACAVLLNAGLGLNAAGERQRPTPAPPPAVSGDRCSPGFTGSPETGCLDVNECAVENGGCSRFARCQNLPGSRTCGSCPDGYAGDGYLGCFDVNDCPAGDCSSKIPEVRQDDRPPVVTSSGDLTVAATSEAGATATFKATAKDAVDGTIPAFCSPRPNSTFKVGKTTVTCWAFNTRGEIGRTTLIVTVTPAQ